MNREKINITKLEILKESIDYLDRCLKLKNESLLIIIKEVFEELEKIESFDLYEEYKINIFRKIDEAVKPEYYKDNKFIDIEEIEKQIKNYKNKNIYKYIFHLILNYVY